MADFCKQCSTEIFSADFGELARTSREEGLWKSLCEGCGSCYVMRDGICVGPCSISAHFRSEEELVLLNLAKRSEGTA